MDKTKIAIGVAAALALAAVGYIAFTRTAGAAQEESNLVGSGLPALLYTSGSGGASMLPVGLSSNAGAMTDTTTGIIAAPATDTQAIVASLQGVLAQISASENVAYNATASDLFATLPQSLAGSNITDLTATQIQDTATGKTTFETHATYSPTPVLPPAPPPPPPAAAKPFIWQGQDYGTAERFRSANIQQYIGITGQAPNAQIYSTLNAIIASVEGY